MLIKLPILINGRKIDHNFKIKIDDNIIELSSLENKKIVNIICFNECLYTKVIYLPMKFYINKNYIFNEFFFYNFVSNINENDFFYIFLNELNRKKNLKLKFYKYLNTRIIQNIFEIYDKKYEMKYNFETIDCFLNFTFYRVVYNLNKYLCIYYKEINDENVLNNCKKTKIILTQIKTIQILYDNKDDKVLNIINNDNFKDVINYLLIHKYDTLIDIVIMRTYKNKFYNNFFKYYLKDNIDYLIYLKLLNLNINNIDNNYKTYFNDILDISKENISFDLFKVIISKDTNYNKNILNNLFYICDKISIIIYKNKINNTFKKILYYTYKFIKKINTKELTISNKVKNIYFIYLDILKNINNLVYFKKYKKIYEKSIYINIFNIVFFYENVFELNKDILFNIQNIFNDNLLLYNICKNLNYLFINYQSDYYKYIFNVVEKNILFFDIIDLKIKDILNKPYILLNSIDDKLSIFKWLQITKKYLNLMYYQPIKLSHNDIINLTELLYFIMKVEEQKLSCINYKKLLYVSNKFKNLIIFNERINLKINDIFIDKNINLGHLVKNIKNNNNITLYDTNDNINKYKMKYLKYKGKYLLNNK